jgi:N-methylhydantoinase B/oxoprolinase/acetone carboxylase alpha subunit
MLRFAKQVTTTLNQSKTDDRHILTNNHVLFSKVQMMDIALAMPEHPVLKNNFPQSPQTLTP